MPTQIPSRNISGVLVTVTPRSRGYEANLRITDPHGKRQRLRKILPTVNEAFAWAEQVIEDARNQVDVRKSGKTTVAMLGELYIREQRLVLGFRPSTISNTQISFQAINPIIGDISLQDLTKHHINDLRNALLEQPASRGKGVKVKTGEPLKLSTVRIYLGWLRAALNFAVDQDLVRANVALASKMPRRPTLTKEQRFFYVPDNETMRDIVSCSGSLSLPGRAKPDLLLYEVMAFFFSQTGTRISEALNLEVTEIDRVAPGVRVGIKTDGSLRFIPVAEELIEQLDRLSYRWKSGQRFVFVHENGERPDGSSVRYRLKKVGEHLGLPERLKPHLFRHYFVTTLLRRGVPMEIVSGLVGHDDSSVTSGTYSHTMPRDGSRYVAAATKDFAALFNG